MKKLLKLALAGALAILPSAVAHAQTDITWWDFLSGGDGVRMKALIKEFNDTHPDIRINATTLEWGVPFYSKVQTAAAVGQQPDIMTYHLSRFPLAIPSGVLRPLAPEELEAAGIKKENYVEASWNSASADGKTYGIPFDVHSVVLYYNKNILKEAGLLGDDGLPKGLDGLDNFNAALEKIKATGKVQYPLSLHTDEGGSMWRVFYTLLSQQGAKFIEGEEILPGEAGVKALTSMANWVSSGYSPELISYEASIALFTSGKAAMHINGVWEVPTMVDLEKNNDLGFEWGAVQIPVLMGQPATWADSHAFAVPNSEERPISPEKLKAVLQIIAWMNEHSISWAGAGHIPAYKPVTESAEFKAMQPNSTYVKLADTAVFDPVSPLAGVGGPIYEATQNFIVPALNGQLDPADAIEQMREELKSQM
ncbi:MAG: ABC transporter substrate-binding protein [Sinorhizobium meliloti]|uniref:ABC transporter substrate-binding protein n=1 Tax=Sinorhizobium TaxID=28105 RepID=UPI0003817FBB|nr:MULTISPECIES: ABC transporter substrate-binding protein [Sinorhizobium]MCG5484678.1 ABC transporter substrate-binding protein [Sinorhizobium meliloti]PND19322.1 ABC transporter substrate-binding protein [Ensifer sp. MMN_5]PND25538.1 ABC transporter substrate-binding protein [Sinorhizobium sp. M4_45]RVP96661.1 ABC transporter substrate-binding protein [Sinorhizobium meliloti]